MRMEAREDPVGVAGAVDEEALAVLDHPMETAEEMAPTDEMGLMARPDAAGASQ